MSSRVPSTIFVIGGTGAQGLPVIRALVADGKYAVRALSRDPESRRAIELSTLGNVSIVKGTFADEAVLRDGLRTAGRAAVSGMRSTLGQSRHNGDGNGVFACSKIGVAAFESLWRDNNDHQLWVDAGVLTEEEIAVLRSTGAIVTNFAGHARAGDSKEMARAVAVIQEHHPAEPIWIEAA